MKFGRLRKVLLSTWLSAALALPTPSFAKDDYIPQAGTDAVPVVFQQVTVGNEVGYIAIAPVPADIEVQTISSLAETAPESLSVMVEGAMDPVAQAIRKSGHLSKIKMFVAGAADIPGKIREKVQKVTDYAKRERVGLMWAFYNASVIGGFTYYASSSVQGGLAVLGALFCWSSFLITKPNMWEEILHGGGEGLRSFFGRGLKMLGYELSEFDKNAFEVTGKFTVAWAANTAVATTVLYNSGHLDGPWQALFYGLLINYNIWDAVLLKKLREEQISVKFAKNYFAFQFFVGTMFEAASYLHLPYSQWVLGATVVSGLAYLLNEQKIEKTYAARSVALKSFFGRLRSKSKTPCEAALMSRAPWEDVQ